MPTKIQVSWQAVAALTATLLFSLTTWAATDAISRLAKVEEKQHLKDIEYHQILSSLAEIRGVQDRNHKLIIEIAKRNGIYVPD